MEIQCVCQNCGQTLLIDDASQQSLQCPGCYTIVFEHRPIVTPEPNPIMATEPKPMLEHSNPQTFPSPKSNQQKKILVVGGSIVLLMIVGLFYALYSIVFAGNENVADGLDKQTPQGKSNEILNRQGAPGQPADQTKNIKPSLPTGRPAKFIDSLQLVNSVTRAPVGEAKSFSSLPQFDSNRKLRMPLELNWMESGGAKYEFEVQIKKGREKHTIAGNNLIEQQHIGEQTFNKDRTQIELQGSCFFVHPDGIAVTSPDIVSYRKKIEVNIDGVWTSASLIGIDQKTNLAFVHVKKGKVDYLELSKNPDIELASKLYCAGFRTADNDNEKAFILPGQVSGLSDSSANKEFQFDTKFTSQHIGGPVFNQNGLVAGITSSEFRMDKLNPVSLGVQSKSIIEMLSEYGIYLPTSTKPISIEALRQKCAKAVHRIKASGTIKQETISYHSNLRLTSAIRGGNRTVSGASLLTNAGGLLKTQGGGCVNLFVAAPGFIGIENVNPYGIDYWQTQSIEFVTKNPDFFISRSQMSEIHAPGPNDFGRMINGLATVIKTDEFTKIVGNEKYYDYRLKRTFRSIDRKKKSPRFFDAELEGIVRFDLKCNKVVKLELAGKVNTSYSSNLAMPVNPNMAQVFSTPNEYEIRYSYALKKLGYRNYEQPPTIASDFILLNKRDHVITGTFSLNNEFFIGSGKRLSIFELKSKKLISRSEKENESYLSIVHSPNKPEFFVSRQNGAFEKWTYNNSGEAFKIAEKHLESRASMAVSNGGNLIATGRNGIIEIWDTNDLSLRQSKSLENTKTMTLRFGPSDKTLVLSSGHSIRKYDVTSLTETSSKFLVTAQNSTYVSPDCKAVLRYDSLNFAMYDIKSGSKILDKRMKDIWVERVLSSSDPNEIVFINKKSISRVQFNDLSVISQIKRTNLGNVFCACLSRDGSMLAYRTGDTLNFLQLKK